MTLAVSNLAWQQKYEHTFLEREDIEYLEIAPYKINNSWELSESRLKDYLDSLREHDVIPYSLQAVLYEVGYNIFLNYKDVIEHFNSKILPMSQIFNIKKIVLGSPRNRKPLEGQTDEEIEEISHNFFTELGELFRVNSPETLVCIEPNAKHYDCSFITNSYQGAELVSRINHPNIKLHLDVGNMSLEKENGKMILDPNVFHFHLSEPDLKPVKRGKHHLNYGQLFRKSSINSLSIEQLSVDNHSQDTANLNEAINTYKTLYE
jgi:sugar phosphate isomerase/epimerase